MHFCATFQRGSQCSLIGEPLQLPSEICLQNKGLKTQEQLCDRLHKNVPQDDSKY